VPIVGQYWPIPRTGGGQIIEIRAVLPGFPAPLGILDYAFDDALIGVVHGFYGTGPREHPEGLGVFADLAAWEGWDWRAEIMAARRRMRGLGALIAPAPSAGE